MVIDMADKIIATVIGRGHSGTRSMSHTLTASGFYMGADINPSGDLVPPEKMYEACKVFAKYVEYKGGMEWDFSKVLSMEPDKYFVELIEDYLSSVLASDAPLKGWKIPETTLVYPWILKMFPDIYYIHWTRDPRDCILNGHVTDNMLDFGINYDKTGEIRHDRAVSWKYQRELMLATPKPKHLLSVRFEDMVFDQDNTLARLSDFLGVKMAKVEMRPDSVGRYKTDSGVHMFDFFKEDILNCGYELE